MNQPLEFYLLRAVLFFLAFVLSWILPRLLKRVCLKKRLESVDLAAEQALRMMNRGIWLLLWLPLLHILLHDFITEASIRFYLDRLLVSLYILALGMILYAFVPLFLHLSRKTVSRLGMQSSHSLNKLTQYIIRFLVVVVALSAILSVWSINLSNLIAGLGIGSLAVALAAQNLLSNLIGGMTIMLDKPFVLDEIIIVGDISGTVETIGWRSTRVRTVEQQLVTLPNAKLMDANIVNVSRMQKRRILLKFSVQRPDDDESVKAFIASVVSAIQAREGLKEEASVLMYMEDFKWGRYRLCLQYDLTSTDYQTYLREREQAILLISECLRKQGLEAEQPDRNFFLQESAGNR